MTGDNDRGTGGLLRSLSDWISACGAVVIDGIVATGDLLLFTLRTLSWLLSRPPRRGTLLPNFYEVGVLSLPVVAITGTFIGMVLAVQSYAQFRGLGLETRLGAVGTRVRGASEGHLVALGVGLLDLRQLLRTFQQE